jgi:probable HAF family extracellular repeat protein
MRSKICGVFLLAAVSIPVVASGQQLPQYEVRDLGTLGGIASGGTDLNDAGDVTGWSLANDFDEDGDTIFHAFLNSDDQMIDLGRMFFDTAAELSKTVSINNAGQITWTSDTRHAVLFDGVTRTELETTGRSEALDINDAGQVTGSFTSQQGVTHPFLFSVGSMLDIGPDLIFGEGRDINNAGQITGRYLSDESSGPFLYSDGTFTQLASASEPGGEGLAINEHGQITGFAANGHAFLYTGGSMIDLGTLGGGSSEGVSINNSGEVVGTSFTFDGRSRAFLYTNDALVDLGTLGGQRSVATKINDAGEVVGYSEIADGTVHAFVFSNDEMLDLGTLGGAGIPGGLAGSIAVDINVLGQITGIAHTSDNQIHAFLATPISLLFSRLLASVTGVGAGPGLANTVARAESYFEADDLNGTCRALSSFIVKVSTPANLRKIGETKVGELASDASRIRSAVGCP